MVGTDKYHGIGSFNVCRIAQKERSAVFFAQYTHGIGELLYTLSRYHSDFEMIYTAGFGRCSGSCHHRLGDLGDLLFP